MRDRSLTFYLNKSAVYAQYYAHDGRLQMGVALKVDPIKFTAGKLPKPEKTYLSKLSGLVAAYEADTRQAGRFTSVAEVEAIILDATGRKQRHKHVGQAAFSKYFNQYLDDVKAGRILNEGKRYSRSYIDIAGVVGRLLPSCALASVPVEKITEEHLRQFGSELTAKGYAKNTVATYFDPILSFINGGRRLGRHKGKVFDARSFRINREDIDHGQYLSEAEQDLIAALAFDVPEREMWRDMFLLGCQLGMRHSDLSRLTPTHRMGDNVNINTTKTTTPVWVPLNARARGIWDKYGGVFTIPSLTPFMEFAKELGELAGIDKPVLFSRTEGGVKVERWVKKWELLGTHTMRRSFATNAYKAGVPMPSIMKVTGHKSTASFLKYIRLSDEEHAVMLQSHPHFM